MRYTLDIYTRNPETLTSRLAASCRARRLERGYSRKTLSEHTGVPAPTIERFERTGRISLESFCRLVIEFDFYEEMSEIIGHTKYSTSGELEAITKNKNRKHGR